MGVKIRKSLLPQGVESLEKAEDWVDKWKEAIRKGEEKTYDVKPPTTIKNATDDFIADSEARNLKGKTVYKYKLLFRQLSEFADLQGIRFVKELDLETLRKFRNSWKDRNLAAQKKLERLRSFFKFAVENQWLEENLAKRIAIPQTKDRPTLPFSQEQMLAIMKAIATNIEKIQGHGKPNARRLRALVLLLRYTGLRISDAVGCSTDRLMNGKLRLYTQKTGTHVHCPLADFVIHELESVPKMSERYWFWTGNGKLETAVADWQGHLQTLFALAKVEGGHAHRFRDTFATELLQTGVPIERVSVLLGHQSVKVTDKHYNAWILERQQQAEANVRRTWTQDPIALLEASGTHEVHQNRRAVN
jgi:integrase/recombinase XerD